MNRADEIGCCLRLHHVTTDASAERFEDVAVHGMYREENDFDGRRDAADRSSGVHTVHERHRIIENRDIRTRLLEIDLAPYVDLTIEDISRGESLVPRNAEAIGKTIEWRWNLASTGGEINLRAAGYKQHVRMAPRHLDRQSVPLSDRGGISFSQGKDR